MDEYLFQTWKADIPVTNQVHAQKYEQLYKEQVQAGQGISNVRNVKRLNKE